MPNFIFTNNLNTTLAGPVTTGATTITLASTANLPASIPAGQVLVITLNDVATRQNYEVMYATARTGATLTVLRAQEGTSALSWLTGDFSYSGPTAGQQASFTQITQFASLLSGSGYKEIPDPNSPSGVFIIQWGASVFPNSGARTSSVTVTTSIPFPTANAFSACMPNGGANSATGGQPSTGYTATTLGTITFLADTLGYTNFNQVLSMRWFAIGY